MPDEIVLRVATADEVRDWLITQLQDQSMAAVIDGGLPCVVINTPFENTRGIFAVSVRQISQAALQHVARLQIPDSPSEVQDT